MEGSYGSWNFPIRNQYFLQIKYFLLENLLLNNAEFRILIQVYFILTFFLESSLKRTNFVNVVLNGSLSEFVRINFFRRFQVFYYQEFRKVLVAISEDILLFFIKYGNYYFMKILLKCAWDSLKCANTALIIQFGKNCY